MGGTGFIGGHLAEYFFKEGEISKGIFRKGSHLRIMDQCGVQCMEANLMDRDTLHEALADVDVVYNLAFPGPGSAEGELTRFEEVAVTNLLEEANEHGVKAFIHLSCLDLYGAEGVIGPNTVPRPKDVHQRAKLATEARALSFGEKNSRMKVRVVRAALAVGPRDTTLTVPILKMIQEGKVVLPSGSNGLLSLSHPKDIAQSLLRAANYSGEYDIPLIKSFDATFEDFSRGLLIKTGGNAEVKLAGLFSGRTRMPQVAVALMRAGVVVDVQDSWAKIGYAPAYTLQQTVEETVEWHRKEPWATEDLA